MIGRSVPGPAGAAFVLLLLGAGAWWFFSAELADRPAGSVVIDVPVRMEGGNRTRTGSDSTPVASVVLTPWLDAPDPELTEDGPHGPLPKISDNGRKPWIAYARPFDVRNDRPRVAVLVTGLGLSEANTAKAIERLPSAITLAFSPYAQKAAALTRRARADGHEIMLVLPMASGQFPFRDAGPAALQASLSTEDNGDRLGNVLSRTFGYVGVVGSGDSPILSEEDSLRPVLSAIGERGLMFVGAGPPGESLVKYIAPEVGTPWAVANVILDDQLSADAIDAALAELEAVARDRAVALGIGRAYPVIVDRLAAWASGLSERGIALAPVSALADRQLFP
ncbi:MAG: divergent polysaccharide deacetylase family protein [Rhodospirillales bacterium]|nr:divergent polysaccharide deacetylase family protein [Rhodospirillales bacterium]